MRISARTTTFLFTLGLVTTTVFVLVFSLEGRLRTQLTRQTEERWLHHLQATGAAIVTCVETVKTAQADDGFLQDYVHELGVGTDVAVCLLDDRAVCVADSRGPPAAGERYGTRPEVKEALAGKTGYRFFGHVDDGTRGLAVALPVRQDDKVTGVVYVSRALTEQRTAFESIHAGLHRVAGRLLLVVLVLAAFGCWWIFRPLQQVAKQAVRAAEAPTPAPLPVGGSAESIRFAKAFNRLSARLVERTRRRAEWLGELAPRVRDAASQLCRAVEKLAAALPPELKATRRQLRQVVIESERTARLVEETALLEQLHAGGVEPEKERLDVRRVCLAAAQRVQPWADCRHVEVQVKAPPTTATFFGDLELLETALFHLLENAVRFSPPETPVILEAWNAHRQASFKVIDRGEGMPEEVRRRCPGRFFTGTPPEDDFPGGAGLGLALAREIARIHDGDLEVLSQVGAGTAVTLTVAA